ncbi:UNKNOWN [Stylonychia lemnae]|uniref:EamA domain-containing protein n=1 Tax=Stylonychia lemnae TaxID=5949 RepID=A0A077ZQC0_STYLE|nr:UNKNOWN [Stylonychia lemnae]|eukprot:CDW72097.1 UNKNOWN [Stylonychia lemnae]
MINKVHQTQPDKDQNNLKAGNNVDKNKYYLNNEFTPSETFKSGYTIEGNTPVNSKNVNNPDNQQSLRPSNLNPPQSSFHTMRLSDRSTSTIQKKVNHTYIILALLASLFNSTGQIVRGYESKNALASNLIQNSTFCIIPFLYLIFRRIKSSRTGVPMIMPWYQDPNAMKQNNILPIENQPKATYKFVPKILMFLMIGGSFEFIGCYFLVLSFHFGQLAHMNDGITSSLILFSCVYILIMQYLIYRDKINFIQAIGMLLILVAVAIVSVFTPDQTQRIHQEAEEHSDSYYEALCILTGLIAAVLFGQEIVFVRVLTEYKVDGELSGYFYPLFVGIYGIIGVISYVIIFDIGEDHYELHDLLLILMGGICESIGMVLQIIASSIGIGGIAFSLANTCCIFVTLFNYLVFSQPISFLQVIGIIMTVLGASIISLDDKITALVQKIKIK